MSARLAAYAASWVGERVDGALWRAGVVVRSRAAYKRSQRNAFEMGRDLGHLEQGAEPVEPPCMVGRFTSTGVMLRRVI